MQPDRIRITKEETQGTQPDHCDDPRVGQREGGDDLSGRIQLGGRNVARSRPPWLKWGIAVASGAVVVAVLLFATCRPRTSDTPADIMTTEEIVQASRGSVVLLLCPEATAEGTGFIVASDGQQWLIATNRHVIDPAFPSRTIPASQKVAVKFPHVAWRGPEGTWGKVAAYYTGDVDLALVLLQDVPASSDVTPLVIRSFQSIDVGEKVVSIGHAMGSAVGPEESVTEGIVSSKREDKWIQTDAAISTGNSGGPLLDTQGRAVGVTTWRVSDEGGAENMNFALRADLIARPSNWEYFIDVRPLLETIRVEE